MQGLPSRLLVSLICTGLLAGSASADILDPSQFFTIQVSNSSGQGSYSVPINTDGEGSVQWQMDPGPIVIQDDVTGTPIATLATSSFGIVAEPRARVDFAFTIVSGAEDTLVEAQSPLLAVGGQDTLARSSVAFELIDGGDGQATMTSAATPLGTGAFRARYNGAGDAGQTFAHMIYQMQISGGAGSTLNANKNFPNFGFGTVPADVDDMSMDMSFTLTPGDALIASGTMELSVSAPEPATLMLLLAGGLLGTRRR